MDSSKGFETASMDVLMKRHCRDSMARTGQNTDRTVPGGGLFTGVVGVRNILKFIFGYQG